MEAVEVPDQPSQERKRYDRAFILGLKEEATVLDARNAFPPINAVDRNIFKKAKSNVSKLPQGRPRDAQNIVLGPQKRTWNTGCHVSHSNERDSFGQKGGKEYRTPDKYKSDFKRDPHGVDRYNGAYHRTEGSYNRFTPKDERSRNSRSLRVEEEPEWFSEGPTTVNDTIELGKLIEDDDAIVKGNCVASKSANRTDLSKTLSAGFVDAPENGHESTATSKLPHLCTTDSTTFSDNQGSRFKDLFSKAEVSDGSGNINDQLMKLMKASSKHFTGSPQKNDVIQVENKLRSILLGRNAQREQKTNSGKPKVLTVEEIEAQMNISPTSGSSVARNVDPVPNPILHGSAPIQPTVISTSGSTTVNNTLNGFGLFANQLVHLPAVTNAVSACSRITKPQQSEMAPPPGFSELNNQGVLRNLWENTQVTPVQQLLMRTPNVPRSPLAPSEFQDQMYSRPPMVFGSAHLNNLSSQRRPIVKVQQSQFDMPGTQYLFGNGDHHRIHNLSANTPGMEKNLINLALHQLQDYNQPEVADRVSTNNLSAVNHDPRFATHHTLMPDTPLTTNIDSTNRNFQYRTGSNRQSNNNLAFLSQFMEMDRSNALIGCSKQSSILHSLLGSNVKPKTLEEIEHQELTSSASFF